MTAFDYLSSTITKYRAGTLEDPYVPISESKKIINNQAQLSEIPVKMSKVHAAGFIEVVELPEEGLLPDRYIVDYNEGIVQFHPSKDGQTVTFVYQGRGNHFVSAARVWVEHNNGEVTKTLSDAIRTISSFDHMGTYNPAVTYQKFNLVSYQGGTYIAIQTTTGKEPTNITFWRKVTGFQWRGTYSSSATYVAGDFVLDSANQNIYTCISESSANVPLTNPSNWDKVISFDALVANVNTAITNANNATSAANTAKDNANTAATNAYNAASAANTAAGQANTTNTNIKNAETLRVAAEEGRVNNEIARMEEEEERVSHESARVAAETARANAETARSTAETARKNAETSRANAETARGSAETARASAETGRVNAESSRVTAENTREGNEASRKSAETSRSNAETGRATAENNRVSAENSRVTAENNRALVETTRVSDENARKTNEGNRVSAESSRVNAESARVTAENNRAAAEGGRASAETARNTAENTREAQETGRKNQEVTRQTNEGTRLTQETARQTNTTNAINTLNTVTSNTKHLGQYNNATAYKPNNMVTYSGSTYMNIVACTNVAPTDPAKWVLAARKGEDGTGTGTLKEDQFILSPYEPHVDHPMFWYKELSSEELSAIGVIIANASTTEGDAPVYFAPSP